MATKKEILKGLTNSYRAKLAADNKRDLIDALDAADEDITDKIRLGVALDDATAADLANSANAKIATYNTAVTLPLIDIADLGAQLAAATSDS